MSNPFLETLIESRRTIHQFKADPIDQKVVLKALELSLCAPNHKLTSPWKYILLNSLQREKLYDLAQRLKSLKGPISPEDVKKLQKQVLVPPSALLMILPKNFDARREREDYATLSCSYQILALYLWDHHIGTKWSTGELSRHPEVYGLTGLDPNKEEIVGLIWIGIPETIPAQPKKLNLADYLKN